MRDVESAATWICLTNVERIQLQVAKSGRLVKHRQVEVLNILAKLSDRLRLTRIGEGNHEWSTNLIVELDGSLLVDIDWDGSLGPAE